MTSIEYKKDIKLNTSELKDILLRSSLGKRRPIDNEEILSGMVNNSNLTITAWYSGKLIGLARCVTDFVYCCYLFDLAVDLNYQKQGIGKELIQHIENNIEKSCKIVLLSAPKAQSYYPKIGFIKHERAYVKNLS